jgi:hypothetical protein
MGAIESCGCHGDVEQRCGGTLPDDARCAIHYHFGMLLGVEDFRAEQGFHLGGRRRHQRALHGWGVVWGYPVSFDPVRIEVRVGPGYALDAAGRDLELEEARCVSLAAWWQKHRNDEAFDDIANKDDVRLELDVMAGYGTCLSRPVPALADPCADGQADIAYARICEVPQLALVRRTGDAPRPPPPAAPYHLLRLLLGLDPVWHDGGGQPLPDDKWLLAALAALDSEPPEQRAAAEQALWRAAMARAAAATAAPGAQVADTDAKADADALALPLARLSGVHIHLDADGWHAEVASVSIDDRPTLLATGLLQDAQLHPGVAAPTDAAGPLVAGGGAALAGTDITLAFDQDLAPASVTAAAFAVSEFTGPGGWAPFTVTAAAVPPRGVKLGLDRAPAAGALLRITVIGTGNAPLLSATLVPAGALAADGDGRNVTTSLRI